jgi:hypothetical protein
LIERLAVKGGGSERQPVGGRTAENEDVDDGEEAVGQSL